MVRTRWRNSSGRSTAASASISSPMRDHEPVPGPFMPFAGRTIAPRSFSGASANWAFGSAALAAVLYLMWKGHGNTFFYDEWTWIVTRSSGLHAIFSSYNNHLLIMPLGLYQLLLRTVGLDHYWLFRLLHTVVHLGCVAAVYFFARPRIGLAACC